MIVGELQAKQNQADLFDPHDFMQSVPVLIGKAKPGKPGKPEQTKEQAAPPLPGRLFQLTLWGIQIDLRVTYRPQIAANGRKWAFLAGLIGGLS